MLYYTALFLIIVLVSVVAIWMYRAIFGVGRSVYQSNVQGSKKLSRRAKARVKARRKEWAQSGQSNPSSETPTPWGWKGNAAPPHSEHMSHVASPPSGPASTRRSIGWPHKEEKVEFAGKAYKVNRKATDDGEMGSDGKPWVF